MGVTGLLSFCFSSQRSRLRCSAVTSPPMTSSLWRAPVTRRPLCTKLSTEEGALWLDKVGARLPWCPKDCKESGGCRGDQRHTLYFVVLFTFVKDSDEGEVRSLELWPLKKMLWEKAGSLATQCGILPKTCFFSSRFVTFFPVFNKMKPL